VAICFAWRLYTKLCDCPGVAGSDWPGCLVLGSNFIRCQKRRDSSGPGSSSIQPATMSPRRFVYDVPVPEAYTLEEKRQCDQENCLPPIPISPGEMDSNNQRYPDPRNNNTPDQPGVYCLEATGGHINGFLGFPAFILFKGNLGTGYTVVKHLSAARSSGIGANGTRRRGLH
jgi:hypothetical protein